MRRTIPLALFDLSIDEMFPEQDLKDTEGFDRLPLAMVEKLDFLIPRRTWDYHPTGERTNSWCGETSSSLGVGLCYYYSG